MKQISAALFLTNSHVFLGCHTTGGKQYDLPKGLIDEGEEPINAVIREAKEETNLTIHKEELYDLGVFKYNTKKDLHIFLCIREILPELKSMNCTSTFTDRYTGKQLPEVDGYKYIPFDQKSDFVSKNMNKTLDELIKRLKK